MTRTRLLIAALLAALTVSLAACGRPGGGAPPVAADKSLAPASAAADKPFIVPPGAVTIKTLPPLLTLRGDAVPFQGKTELVQKLAGRAAAEIVVVAFAAGGENAHKSAIRITWEDGAVETIPPGARNLIFAPQRRAKSIAVLGYSFHERRVFKDIPKKGTLTWEIRYAPVE